MHISRRHFFVHLIWHVGGKTTLSVRSTRYVFSKYGSYRKTCQYSQWVVDDVIRANTLLFFNVFIHYFTLKWWQFVVVGMIISVATGTLRRLYID